MRLAMSRSGRIKRLPLLLLLVAVISVVGVLGKPQQGAGAGEESPEGDYTDNYDEYSVDYEPEYEEGTLYSFSNFPSFARPMSQSNEMDDVQFVRSALDSMNSHRK